MRKDQELVQPWDAALSGGHRSLKPKMLKYYAKKRVILIDWARKTYPGFPL
jgi:hypothetical protein